jgi:hypothetical protein
VPLREVSAVQRADGHTGLIRLYVRKCQWLAALRDDYGVDWTMPDAEHYRCTDEPLPTGMAA